MANGASNPPFPPTPPGKPGKGDVFTPLDLESSIIAVPLVQKIQADGPDALQPVIIDLNLDYPGGRQNAKQWVIDTVAALLRASATSNAGARGKQAQGLNLAKSRFSDQYLFGELQGKLLQDLVGLDSPASRKQDPKRPPLQRAVYHIWPDFEIEAFINKSVSTIKADAARASFAALGEGIVWAVMDSGIDGSHPHFQAHTNLSLDSARPLDHFDFTVVQSGEDAPPKADGTASATTDIQPHPAPAAAPAAPGLEAAPVPSPTPVPVPVRIADKTALVDESGHGTHVAGIIAGDLAMVADEGLPGGQGGGPQVQQDPQGGHAASRPVRAYSRHKDEFGNLHTVESEPGRMSGMAPKCKLVSLKVLDGNGKGRASNLIAAISYVQEMNGHGRRIRIHGVNMSVGYDFEPKWFACGQSPLCVEVDRLVRSGVVVVVAAGNTGYGMVQSEARGWVGAGMDLSINDPGNAELAITVGATHREMPHVYGVSYFSSKGPTGDGRLKPDLVAPGEKILSCAAGKRKQALRSQVEKDFEYLEESGTSMAAPHVSGVIAAFLSIRREFIGHPEKVKEIFMETATDLRRERYFQGKGLVDLMRAIQSV